MARWSCWRRPVGDPASARSAGPGRASAVGGWERIRRQQFQQFRGRQGNYWNGDWHHGWGGRLGCSSRRVGPRLRLGLYERLLGQLWGPPVVFGHAWEWGLEHWGRRSMTPAIRLISNPYYTSGAEYDYSEPIQVVAQPAEVVVVRGRLPIRRRSSPRRHRHQPFRPAAHIWTPPERFALAEYDKAGRSSIWQSRKTDGRGTARIPCPWPSPPEAIRRLRDLYAVLSMAPAGRWTR